MPLKMYRIVVTKVSSTALKQKNCNGSSRLFKTLRHYSNNKQNVCPPKVPKKGASGTVYTLGALTLIGGGTIGYAKYDPDFRAWLNSTIPYSDNVINFIFQEDKSFVESFLAMLDAIKASFLNLLFGEESKKSKPITEKPIEYTPPSPAFTTLAKETKDVEEQYTEIRVEKIEQGKPEPSVTIGGEVKHKEALSETHPKSLYELETKINESASACVQAYNKAVYALKNYNQDVKIVIEDSIERLDPSIWHSLREKTKAKEQTRKEAEQHAKDATDSVNKLKELLKEPRFEAPDPVKQQVQLNIKRVTTDIESAKKELEREQLRSSVTDRYWRKVEEARSHFIDEIEILFPNIDIQQKKLDMEGPELDLFILHAFANVLYYQKEMFKLQTVEEEKLKTALEAARRGNKDILTDAQIDALVEKEKRNLENEFRQKCLCLRIESEKELRRQLKLQSEAFADHLSDAIKNKQMEMEREFARTLDEKVTEEKCKYKLQLSALAGRVKGMDQALKARAEADKIAKQSQVLWSACQALFRSLKVSCPGLPWTEQLRPLEAEIVAVQHAAAKGDELVQVVLEGIPKLAKERGVFPEDALRERFLKVEKVCRQVALLPEGGGRLPLHLLSYLQSLLLLKAASPIPQAELDDKQVNFKDLGTNDILQRARYWLDRGDFTQTLKYMNLLDGAPRCIARQWMDETRVLLETQQAANTLMAHAAASGLMYL